MIVQDVNGEIILDAVVLANKLKLSDAVTKLIRHEYHSEQLQDDAITNLLEHSYFFEIVLDKDIWTKLFDTRSELFRSYPTLERSDWDKRFLIDKLIILFLKQFRIGIDHPLKECQ